MPDNDTLPCPGCHTPLPLEATGCQICMRARSKIEIVRGYAKLREEKARKRRRPFLILAVLLVLGAGGKLFLTHRDRLAAAAGAATGAVTRWLDDMRNPSNYAGRREEEPSVPAAPAAPGSPVAPEDALRTQLFPPDSPPAPAAAKAPSAARPAEPKPLAKNAWRVSGTVYDLMTLGPVPGALITFALEGRPPEAATTDERGAYEIDLAKKDGWTVSLEAPEHRRGQMLDIDPPYRVRDADERRAALEHITDGDLGPAPVDWKGAQSKVRLDLVAVPENWNDERRR